MDPTKGDVDTPTPIAVLEKDDNSVTPAGGAGTGKAGVVDLENRPSQTKRSWLLVLLAFLSVFSVNLSFDELLFSTENSKTRTKDAKTTLRGALVMRTMSPIRPSVLERIHRIAKELSQSTSSDGDLSRRTYDFWVLVDETTSNGTVQQLEHFFSKYESTSGVVPPKVFAVSEQRLFETYPKLVSYTYNAPDPNFNNESGVCCGRPIMWQMFVPTFGMFMTETQYEIGWTFEDDIGVQGQWSLLELIKAWDDSLDDTVDLAAIMLRGEHWGAVKHTMPMEEIVQNMWNASVGWRLYSDAIQRHSLALSESIVKEVSNNVMSFGERLIHPIAWKHNHTIVDLTEVQVNGSLFNLDQMTGQPKLTNSAGIQGLLKVDAAPATFVFHEELPDRRRLRSVRSVLVASTTLSTPWFRLCGALRYCSHAISHTLSKLFESSTDFLSP